MSGLGRWDKGKFQVALLVVTESWCQLMAGSSAGVGPWVVCSFLCTPLRIAAWASVQPRSWILKRNAPCGEVPKHKCQANLHSCFVY